MPRMIFALAVCGMIAPALFLTIMGVSAAIADLAAPMTAAPPSRGNVPEIFGLALTLYLVTAPVAIATAIVAGLPAVWLARRWQIESTALFIVGGAVVAVGLTAWFARDAIAHPNWPGFWDSMPFTATMALTGAISGLVYSRIGRRRP